MHLRNTIIFSLIGLFSLMGTTCQKAPYDPKDYKKPAIHFGSGGGFSGIETTFVLVKQGYLFKKVGNDSTYQLIRKVPAKTCREAFKQMKNLPPSLLKTQQPGNLYQFIEVKVEGETHRMIWGDEEKPVDSELKTLYKELMSLYQQEM
ncbi:MAG: hypothetical protein AAF824_22400 [Bacteroidota bacterium]